MTTFGTKAKRSSARERELSAREMDAVNGGFNPQPDPPAKALSAFPASVNPAQTAGFEYGGRVPFGR